MRSPLILKWGYIPPSVAAPLTKVYTYFTLQCILLMPRRMHRRGDHLVATITHLLQPSLYFTFINSSCIVLSVHCVILAIQLFFVLPRTLIPSTLPCIIDLFKLLCWHTCPQYDSFILLIVASSGSYLPTNCIRVYLTFAFILL